MIINVPKLHTLWATFPRPAYRESFGDRGGAGLAVTRSCCARGLHVVSLIATRGEVQQGDDEPDEADSGSDQKHGSSDRALELADGPAGRTR